MHFRQRKIDQEPPFLNLKSVRGMVKERPPKVSVLAPAADFEVTCPSGHEVKVPARFEARALRELLAVLEGR